MTKLLMHHVPVLVACLAAFAGALVLTACVNESESNEESTRTPRAQDLSEASEAKRGVGTPSEWQRYLWHSRVQLGHDLEDARRGSGEVIYGPSCYEGAAAFRFSRGDSVERLSIMWYGVWDVFSSPPPTKSNQSIYDVASFQSYSRQAYTFQRENGQPLWKGMQVLEDYAPDEERSTFPLDYEDSALPVGGWTLASIVRVLEQGQSAALSEPLAYALFHAPQGFSMPSPDFEQYQVANTERLERCSVSVTKSEESEAPGLWSIMVSGSASPLTDEGDRTTGNPADATSGMLAGVLVYDEDADCVRSFTYNIMWESDGTHSPSMCPIISSN